ncbi:MAG TPA: PP2C family serine/threonine-protein phosphatase [Rhodanobacteraceae bacterium]
MIEFGHGTHVGLRRPCNEDTYCADGSTGLFLVADGMGGHTHGDLAAALARDMVSSEVRHGQSLTTALRVASLGIDARRQHNGDASPMGTTVAALRIADHHFEAAWVGDSCLYLLHGNRLHALSRDRQTWPELASSGVLDADTIEHAECPNALTQTLGVTRSQDLNIASMRGRLLPGAMFLVCTDGLSEDVPTATLAALLARADLAAQEIVDQLLLAALDAGGRDNATAIVIRCRRS